MRAHVLEDREVEESTWGRGSAGLLLRGRRAGTCGEALAVFLCGCFVVWWRIGRGGLEERLFLLVHCGGTGWMLGGRRGVDYRAAGREQA